MKKNIPKNTDLLRPDFSLLTAKRPSDTSFADSKKLFSVPPAPNLQKIAERECESYQNPPFAAGLIQQVRLYRRKTKSAFHDRFYTDAEKYFMQSAEKCDPVHFYCSLPRYSVMNDEQLRYYFYWRQCIRTQNYPPADPAYIFLLAFEIINLPKKIPPKEGLTLLCNLWLHYRQSYAQLNSYFGEWICDYCLIHKLTPPYEQLHSALPELISHVSFGEFFLPTDQNRKSPFSVFLIDALCPYRYRSSKFYPQNAALYDRHIYPAVAEVLEKMWIDGYDLGLQLQTVVRESFAGALCPPEQKYRMEISYFSIEKSIPLKLLIGDVVKSAENCLRETLQIRRSLQTTVIGEDIKLLMQSYFTRRLESTTPKASNAEAENVFDRFLQALSPKEVSVLQAVIIDDRETLCADKDRIEALCRHINCVAVQTFGAAAVQSDAGQTVPNEQYINEITDAFIRKEEQE